MGERGGTGIHQPPDVRHGPAYFSTFPPLRPRRSMMTRTGIPPSTRMRAGTGNRNRRIASLGTDAALFTATGESRGVKDVISNTPGCHESTVLGDPQHTA